MYNSLSTFLPTSHLPSNPFFTQQPERPFKNSNLLKSSHSSLLPLEIKCKPLTWPSGSLSEVTIPCPTVSRVLCEPPKGTFQFLHPLVPLGLCIVCSFYWENLSPLPWANSYACLGLGFYVTSSRKHSLAPQVQVTCLPLCSWSPLCFAPTWHTDCLCLWPAHLPLHRKLHEGTGSVLASPVFLEHSTGPGTEVLLSVH